MSVYPSHIPYEIPPIEKGIIALFEEACKEFADKSAFNSFDKQITYKELYQLSFKLASFLQKSGLQKGDVIILQLPNILQYPVSVWASLLSGLVVSNMNPLYTSREMLLQIKDSNAKAIILLSSSAKKLEGIIDNTHLQTVIVTEPGDLLDFPKKQIVNTFFRRAWKGQVSLSLPGGFSFLKALSAGSGKSFQVCERSLDDILFIQYTGGTTGISKGASLSQRNILSNLKQCELWMASSLEKGKERVLAPLPLYHIFAFLVNGLLLFLYGAENVLIADPRQIPRLIRTMKKRPLSIMVGVNTLFKALLQNSGFKKLNFSSFKFFLAGGMSLEPSVQRRWREVTGIHLIEGYGLTEASPVVCCNSLEDPEEGGYVGFPLPSTKIRIVDEQGRELPIGEEGELEVKGPQVMKGYYKKEEETKNVLDDEGWLKTGDIATVNERGLVKIKDRKKDMINISGLKVFPNEVEEALLLHEAVREAVVVGVKDESSKEQVKAFIVKKEDSLTEEALKDHCRRLIAPYKAPKEFEFINEIPKTTVGKPLRRFLRKRS